MLVLLVKMGFLSYGTKCTETVTGVGGQRNGHRQERGDKQTVILHRGRDERRVFRSAARLPRMNYCDYGYGRGTVRVGLCSIMTRLLQFCLFFATITNLIDFTNSADGVIDEDREHGIENIIRIKHAPYKLDEKLAARVPCTPSPPCTTRYYYGYEIERTAMTLVDNRNKILMEIIPKADCSGATVMFAQNMGFRYGLEYDGWPHHFRKKYLYTRCGRATPCMMYDPSYFRFKVVRNPYSRVVSGFIHIMRAPLLLKNYVTEEQRKNWTFNDFLQVLQTLNETELQHYGQGHCSFQSQPFERRYYGQKHTTIYHAFVHAENSKEQLKAINEHLGTSFSLHNIIRQGATKNRYQKEYVGSMPWWQLKDRIPKDYGLFYSKYSKQIVEKVFHWDLLLYNYTFPYKLAYTDDDVV